MRLPLTRGIQTVLFDMDGTLILSEDRTEQAVMTLLAAHGVAVDAQSLEPVHGITWEATAEWLVRRWPALQQVDIAAQMQRLFHQSFITDPPPQVPGARVAVQAAAAAHPTGVVTSSERETLDLVCHQLGLDGLLTATFSAQDCAHSKPSPEPYLQAARRLGVDPARCLVFEDSAAGVESALAAGAEVIAVGTESGHEPWIADYRELPEGFFGQARARAGR